LPTGALEWLEHARLTVPDLKARKKANEKVVTVSIPDLAVLLPRALVKLHSRDVERRHRKSSLGLTTTVSACSGMIPTSARTVNACVGPRQAATISFSTTRRSGLRSDEATAITLSTGPTRSNALQGCGEIWSVCAPGTFET
jgi:hypothetical protein